MFVHVKINIPMYFQKHVVHRDISRYAAQLLGQQISTLMPETPEAIARKLGFGINGTVCKSRGKKM
jgi:hypothetical protein